MFGLMLLQVNPHTPIAFGRQKKRIANHPKTINLHGFICLADFFHWTIHTHVALFNPNSLLAHALYLVDIMGHKQQGGTVVFNQIINASLTLFLKAEITDRRASSTTRISGVVAVAIANAMRATIPEE